MFDFLNFESEIMVWTINKKMNMCKVIVQTVILEFQSKIVLSWGRFLRFRVGQHSFCFLAFVVHFFSYFLIFPFDVVTFGFFFFYYLSYDLQFW